MRKPSRLALLGLLALWLIPELEAHPVPDLPVRSYFEPAGSAVIRVEVDPRCFATDPEQEPYLQKWVWEQMTNQERQALTSRAGELIKKSVVFRFEPLGRVDPEFEFRFTGHNNAALEKIDDPVMVTAEWKTTVPAGVGGYRISALKEGKLSVLFLNHINGVALERINVLFPGETSFQLDLSQLSAITPPPSSHNPGASVTSDRWSTLGNFLREGFVHVVPKGLDHILFVLGLFLLCREWRPVVWQVTMFTLAHTITLALSTLGLITLPGPLVETVIAGSIAVVAVENIFHPRYTQWRLVIVFAFGLVHGLGFAGALRQLDLPPASLAIGLLGFNVGVELGQLAVIALAITATFWLRDAARYRQYVVIPGSTLIALAGLWWMIERLGASL